MPVERSPNKTTHEKNQHAGTEEEDGEEILDEVRREWQRLREEQKKLEETRAEIERLRASIPVAANTRGKGGRKAATRDQGETEERIVNGVMSQINYMQVDIKPPKFRDEYDMNPNEFLEDVEKFFQFKHVREEHKTVVVESLLEGRAKVWANSMMRTFTNFNMFKESFLQEFYSIPIKVKLKTQWLSQRYRYNENTMQEYFYQQRRVAQNLEPRMSDYEINYTIIQQYPIRVREALAACEYGDVHAIVQALSRLDGIQRDRESDKKRNTWNREYRHNENIDGRRADANISRIKFDNNRLDGDSYRDGGYYRNSAPYWRNPRENHYRYNYRQQSHHTMSNNSGSVNSLPDTRYPPPNFINRQNLRPNLTNTENSLN